MVGFGWSGRERVNTPWGDTRISLGSVSSTIIGSTTSATTSSIGCGFTDGIYVDGAWMLALTSSGDKVLTQLEQAHFPGMNTIIYPVC